MILLLQLEVHRVAGEKERCMEIGESKDKQTHKMTWNPWAHRAGNHKNGLEPVGVLQEQLSP